MVEFILCAGILSIIFAGILGFGKISASHFSAEIEVRNAAIRGEGGKSDLRFRQYIFESAEMVRFFFLVELPMNKEKAAFSRVLAGRTAAPPGRYKTKMALDKGYPTLPPDFNTEATERAGKNLFGEAFEIFPEEAPGHLGWDIGAEE